MTCYDPGSSGGNLGGLLCPVFAPASPLCSAVLYVVSFLFPPLSQTGMIPFQLFSWQIHVTPNRQHCLCQYHVCSQANANRPGWVCVGFEDSHLSSPQVFMQWLCSCAKQSPACKCCMWFFASPCQEWIAHFQSFTTITSLSRTGCSHLCFCFEIATVHKGEVLCGKFTGRSSQQVLSYN